MRRVRILVVDDYEPWRRFVCSVLSIRPEYDVIAEGKNGLEAVGKTLELQPDLVLLDIGLPILNGIEAARRIRQVSPGSRVLLISEVRMADVAEEALSGGVAGFVVKSAATSELLVAVDTVLQGKPFVSALLGRSAATTPDGVGAGAGQASRVVTHAGGNGRDSHCHEVGFYPDDAALVSGYARRIAAALRSGNGVLLIATQPHRVGVYKALKADGIDVDAAVGRGNLLPLDAVDAVSDLMAVSGSPDPVRCGQLVHDLITRAGMDEGGAARRVSICGECAPTLLLNGNHDGAMQLEHLWDEITRGYNAATLCGYLVNTFPSAVRPRLVASICAEHSAIHGQEYMC